METTTDPEEASNINELIIEATDAEFGISGFLNIYGPLVKWLRHRPFKAVSWVQILHGSPYVEACPEW